MYPKAGIFTPVAPIFTYAEGWGAGLPESIVVNPEGQVEATVPATANGNGAVIANGNGNGAVQQAGIFTTRNLLWAGVGLGAAFLLLKAMKG